MVDEKAREAQRAYMREWRRKNKDKVRESNRRYWMRRAQRTAEKGDGDRNDSFPKDTRCQ